VATSEIDEPLIELGESLKETIREWRIQHGPEAVEVRFALVRNNPDPAHLYDVDIVAYAEPDIVEMSDVSDNVVENVPDFQVISSNSVGEDGDGMKSIHDLVGGLEEQWEKVRALRVKLQSAHERSVKVLRDSDEILERSIKARASAERTMALSRKARS